MKHVVMALLAVGLSASPALCAEMIVASKIDAVDLHPDSAEVTRLARVSLAPGDTSIILRGLSPRLVSQSLRVSGLEGNGVSIRSVSTRRNAPPDVRSPQEQALIDEQDDLRGRLDALGTKQRMILNVANAQPNVAIGAVGSATSPQFWSSIWTNVADALEDTDRRRRETQKRLDAATKTLIELREADRHTALSTQTVEIVLDVAANRATEADLRLVYQVDAANWQPFYDARLQTDRQPAQLILTRRARISQASGEDWIDVVLTLSTSRLSAATNAPILNETSDVTGNSRDGVIPVRTVSPAGEVLRYDFAKVIPTQVPQAATDDATPYDASLAIPGRVSIATNAKAKVFSIDSRTTDVDMYARSAPVADKHAYLQAKFETKDRVPLIPGEAELYRDGTFVGRTLLKGAAPGDQVIIGFGIDDLVSIERSDLKRRERNTTVNAGIASVERAFKMVVVNRHPFPIRIEIDDREPAFNNVAIVLKELPSMTPPTERQIDGHRGVLAWTYRYAPGETRSMTLAWNVRWPAKLGTPQGSVATQVFRFTGSATF